MKKSWGLIPKILSGEKTIESRWYQTKRVPWDGVQAGDSIFFKNSGELVTAQAEVSRVLQFTIQSISDAQKIVDEYDSKICLVNSQVHTWEKVPKYCILMFLQNPKIIFQPFQINKKGFGAPVAWVSVENIETIKL